jgi:hypothetical protein
MLNASIDMCYFGAPVRLNDWIDHHEAGEEGEVHPPPHRRVGLRWARGPNGRTVSIYRLIADDAKTEEG